MQIILAFKNYCQDLIKTKHRNISEKDTVIFVADIYYICFCRISCNWIGLHWSLWKLDVVPVFFNVLFVSRSHTKHLWDCALTLIFPV